MMPQVGCCVLAGRSGAEGDVPAHSGSLPLSKLCRPCGLPSFTFGYEACIAWEGLPIQIFKRRVRLEYAGGE